MSHTTTQKAVCTNEIVLKETCKRAGAEYLGNTTHELFSSSHRGHGVKLPDWSYPVVFTEQGEMHFDDYNGRWGSRPVLDKFLQLYPLEATKHEYAGRGTITEEVLANGDIKCVVTLGGGTQVVDSPPTAIGPGGIALA